MENNRSPRHYASAIGEMSHGIPSLHFRVHLLTSCYANHVRRSEVRLGVERIRQSHQRPLDEVHPGMFISQPSAFHQTSVCEERHGPIKTPGCLILWEGVQPHREGPRGAVHGALRGPVPGRTRGGHSSSGDALPPAANQAGETDPQQVIRSTLRPSQPLPPQGTGARASQGIWSAGRTPALSRNWP